MEIQSERRSWNQGQQALRQALTYAGDHRQAIEMFLSQHAMVHSAVMSHSGLFSFADEVWRDTTEEALRRIPQSQEHSVVWIMWHVARIEDVTMNLLVAGSPQLLHGDDWLVRMGVTFRDTGNAMDEAAVAKLSAAVDIEALRAYRVAVGRTTRDIVRGLQPDELMHKVDPARPQQVMDEGAVVAEARGLIDYWGKRNIAGLLLMPPTRHNFLHLNEAWRVKHRRR